MPETKLKELHMADSIEDLDKRSYVPNIREKKIKVVCNSAKKLYDEAEVERKNGDEELSYLHYMKYVEILTQIKAIPGYEKEKKYVSDMIGSDMPIQALEWASKLKTSLISRYKEKDNYKLNSEAEKIRQKISADIAKAKKIQNEKNVYVYPKTKNLNVEDVDMISDNITRNNEEMTIKSIKLYILLKDKNIKVLILDTRKSSDYEESHISFPQCINIPEECIVAGFTANKLEKSLPSQSKYLWSERSSMDYIVLLDWSSTSLIPGKSLHLLKTILLKWDPHVIYKNVPIILDGGFEDWLLTYPSYVTNPHVIPPSSHSEFDDLLNEIEYPTLSDPVFRSENNKSFDRSMKSNIEKDLYSDSTHKGFNPNVDRSSKAAALHTYEERSKTMKNILEKQEKLAGVSLNIEKQRVLAEQNWEQLRITTEEESDNQLESNQLREQELISEIMQLENVQRDMALENQQLRDQLKEYKKREEIIKASEISPISDSTEPSSGNSSPTDNNLATDEISEQMERNLAAEALAKENKIKCIEEEKAALEKQREMMQADREKILADAREKKKLLFQQYETEKENSSPEMEVNSYEINNSSAAIKDTKNFDSKSNIDVPQFDRTTKPLNSTTAYVENIQNKYRDFQGAWGNQGRGLTGLKNLGNTCYMNSIIQCLNNTSYLGKYFCDGLYRKHINVGPRNDKDNKTHGAIAEEIAAVVKALWSGQYRFISPKDLRNIVGRHKSMFRGIEQQDSHEFLTILMDWLHDDLQISANQHIHSDRLAAADKAWLEYTKSKESLILKLFYGQIKSTVKCLICGKESVTYDTFSNLSLELPSNANKCSLSDCLELYLSDENIIGWNCPLCKEKRNAIKKLDISKLPPVLVIHFKRFYVDQDYNSNIYRKKQTYIDFPLKNLDMNYYALPSHQNKQKTMYNLYGVSNHYGSMEGGHYTAFCKSSIYSKWFKFDDHSVTEISSNDVVSSAAYILFYTTDSALQQ